MPILRALVAKCRRNRDRMTVANILASGDSYPSVDVTPKGRQVFIVLYHFNVAGVDAAANRVKNGGGQILNGPLQVPVGSWAQCFDLQGAVFALLGPEC